MPARWQGNDNQNLYPLDSMLQERGSGFRACGNGMLQGRGQRRKERRKGKLCPSEFWGLGWEALPEGMQGRVCLTKRWVAGTREGQGGLRQAAHGDVAQRRKQLHTLAPWRCEKSVGKARRKGVRGSVGKESGTLWYEASGALPIREVGGVAVCNW